MDLPFESESIQAEKLRIAILYGAAAGIVFATVAWGYDAFMLARSHALYWWIPYLIGLVLCTGLGSLAGWLTYRINHFLASFIIWLAVGIVFSWLASHLSLEITHRIILMIDPGTGRLLHYSVVAGTLARGWIIKIVVVGLMILAGLLEISLADSTISSTGVIGRYFALVFWMVLFFLSGMAVENNLTGQLAEPVINLDETIQYAVDHPSESLAFPRGTALHLNALLDIKDSLGQPRQLILQGYDSDLYNTTVIVHFPSAWAVCNMLDGQPVYCKPATTAELARPPE